MLTFLPPEVTAICTLSHCMFNLWLTAFLDTPKFQLRKRKFSLKKLHPRHLLLTMMRMNKLTTARVSVHMLRKMIWLVVFNVPSTARSFRDGTLIYCLLQRTWSSVFSPYPPGIEPWVIAWQSITQPLRHASSLAQILIPCLHSAKLSGMWSRLQSGSINFVPYKRSICVILVHIIGGLQSNNDWTMNNNVMCIVVLKHDCPV